MYSRHITFMTLDRSSEESIVEHARLMEGKTLEEINPKIRDTDDVSFVHKKGNIGLLIESCFKTKIGSKPLPDLPEAGIEIKSVPLKTNGKVDQPVSLNLIDYCREISACTHSNTDHKCNSLSKSSLYRKGQKILFVCYERNKDKNTKKFNHSKFIIKHTFLWEMNKHVREELETDYQIITNMIKTPGGMRCTDENGNNTTKCKNNDCKTNLHQKQNKYLTTCPKHSGKFHLSKTPNNSVIQPFSSERAERRAFRLKSSYVNLLIKRSKS